MALTPDRGEIFLQEVDENYRRDRARDFAKRYGKWLVAAVILLLAAVGGPGSLVACGGRSSSRYRAGAAGRLAEHVASGYPQLPATHEATDGSNFRVRIWSGVEELQEAVRGADGVPYVVDRLVVGQSRDELGNPIDELSEQLPRHGCVAKPAQADGRMQRSEQSRAACTPQRACDLSHAKRRVLRLREEERARAGEGI